MNYITLIGYIAAFCTTASFIPQAIKIIRTKDTSGISLMMYALFTCGIFLWLLFGIFSDSLPIILANGVTLILSSLILYYRLRYK